MNNHPRQPALTRQIGRCKSQQKGVSLIVLLMLLIASVFLGTSGAVIVLQAEKSSRVDRDRQTAFQAAEAALIDAENDIDTAPNAAGPVQRSYPFLPDSALGFAPSDNVSTNPSTNCISGDTDPSQGLCRRVLNGTPSWHAIDLADSSPNSQSVEYGKFTGQSFPVKKSGLSSQPPRYVIELIPYKQPGLNTEAKSYFYRITAIGFGADADTQVVLQAFYRRNL
jgi:type IV pilus assembly protein PilX